MCKTSKFGRSVQKTGSCAGLARGHSKHNTCNSGGEYATVHKSQYVTVTESRQTEELSSTYLMKLASARYLRKTAISDPCLALDCYARFTSRGHVNLLDDESGGYRSCISTTRSLPAAETDPSFLQHNLPAGRMFLNAGSSCKWRIQLRRSLAACYGETKFAGRTATKARLNAPIRGRSSKVDTHCSEDIR